MSAGHAAASAVADPWVYPRFLRLAAQADDPVERMQWVISWFVAGGWGRGRKFGTESPSLLQYSRERRLAGTPAVKLRHDATLHCRCFLSTALLALTGRVSDWAVGCSLKVQLILAAGLHHAFERWAKPFNPILGKCGCGVEMTGLGEATATCWTA